VLRLVQAALLIVSCAATHTFSAAPGDLVLPRKSEETGAEVVPPSKFPHWIHRVQFRCDACHNRLFKMELGASEITMEAMSKGESCGVCHNGERAFAVDFNSCNRCHTSPED